MKILDYERRTKNSLRVIIDEIMTLENAEREYFGIIG